MNRCKVVRDKLARARSLLYKLLPMIDDISAETVSVELGRGSVALDDVEDDITRATKIGEDAVECMKDARMVWIETTHIPDDVK